MIKINKPAGFTILEVLIAASIIAIIMVFALGSLMSIQANYGEQVRIVNLETEINRVGDFITEYMGECKVISPPVTATGHTEITFQVPVAVSGSYCDASGNIYWGAGDTPDWKFVFRFNPNGVVLDETTSRIDYNRDGQLRDRFVHGNMQCLLKDNSDNMVVSSLMGSNIFLRESPLEGDVNGDGMPDPLFLMVNSSGMEDILAGNRLIVNLWLGQSTPQGASYIVNRVTEKRLQNSQSP
ncbi:MAG: prepilin-type N-terminal cleavage/methylation domain-containing protein [Planctomycetes bacterium]|nr:prepilin-type N-terminal cleavage/methylation domain-containing protein [Planctomycetota bacterium]